MCMIDDADPWTVFHSEMRKARKPWQCKECRRQIGPGERYEYAAGLYEGDWSTYRTCEQCVEAIRWLRVVCDGYLFNMVEEDLTHHIRGQDEEYMSSSKLVRLVRWMEARWLDREGRLRPVEAVRVVVDRAIEQAELKLNPTASAA